MRSSVRPKLTSPTRSEGTNPINAIMRGNSAPLDSKDTAQYLADIILELRNMAKAAQLHKVMVPLEFAYYEAFTSANAVAPPEEEVKRLHELSKASGVATGEGERD